MREILFRAKRIDNGEWREGYYFTMSETTYAFAEDYERHPVPTHHYIVSERMTDWSLPSRPYFEKVDPETVCQYTGLKDKNGRKIFEGDVVKGVAYSIDFIGYIVWIDEIAGFGVRYFNKRREPTAWENSSILKAIQRWKQPNEFQAEVIGNIFDNPELVN